MDIREQIFQESFVDELQKIAAEKKKRSVGSRMVRGGLGAIGGSVAGNVPFYASMASKKMRGKYNKYFNDILDNSLKNISESTSTRDLLKKSIKGVPSIMKKNKLVAAVSLLPAVGATYGAYKGFTS